MSASFGPLCFVSVRGHNAFMTELLSALAASVAELGVDVDFAFDEFPALPANGRYVVIPHEYYGHRDVVTPPTAEQRTRTVALCTENPGTPWFEFSAQLLPHFASAVVFNRTSATELRRRGLPCEHFQLGYSPKFDAWQRHDADRQIDVLYLGAADASRAAVLADCGRHLWHRQCELLIPALNLRGVPARDNLIGADKYERLTQSRLLLNLHRRGASAFEWVRYLEAVANGCVVVSEPSTDHGPLVVGEHLITADAASMPFVLDELLEQPDRIAAIREAAYEFVRTEMTMTTAAQQLVDVVSALPSPPSNPAKPELSKSSLAVERPAEPQDGRATGGGALSLRDITIQTRALQRDLADLTFRLGHLTEPGLHVRATTPTFDALEPRVTIIVTLYNLRREIADSLSSVVALDGDVPFDVLILDDASTDGSFEAAADFLDRHPRLPAQLLSHDVNRGLARSRNTLLERARGSLALVLDADNGLYPPALARMTAALDADANATFAYPIIAVFQHGSPAGLLGAQTWSPELLRSGNYIDAMTLLRRDRILGLGGYVTDPRLTGWEDFYLWCLCAEAGERGVLVPQILAWYRRTEHSMISEMVGNDERAWSLMRERFTFLRAAERTTAE